MSREFLTRSWLLVVALAGVVGCDRAASVSGVVTYDGQPVENGFITFSPADGKGPQASSPIENGKYQVDTLTPGPKQIQVMATRDLKFAGSREEQAREYAERKAKGRKKSAERADVIPANAVGNNQAVEIMPGNQTLDFHLEKPR